MATAERSRSGLPPPLFGTDGVRGQANAEPMTAETVVRLGRALGCLCTDNGAHRASVVIGKDTRRSGDMLESALAAGLCSMGIDALLAGVFPTPGVAFLTRHMPADAGAVISASHNPFEDNGLKFFARTGFKLPDDAEREIERLMCSGGPGHARPTGAAVGRVRMVTDAAARYTAFLTRTFPCALAGVKIVVDCAHGAAYRVAPAVLTGLGAHVVAIGVSPDGANINCDAGALHPQPLQETVRAQGADLGLALDGDADRAILVDEHGDVVDGDEMLAMLAAAMLSRGTLKQSTVVATVMSNLGLELALRERGARLVRVQVGDRYVVQEMRRRACNLGGEQSGHLIFLDHATTGDGLAAGLSVLRVMVDRQRPLSELKRAMVKFPQVLLNVPVTVRRDLDAIAPVRETIARVNGNLADRGRALVRYSGTEPLVRVMVEGEDAARVRAYAQEIAATITAHVRP
ncbi:MAG: phosphoglucosamine mutase [Candidatus Binatia bacterium]